MTFVANKAPLNQKPAKCFHILSNNRNKKLLLFLKTNLAEINIHLKKLRYEKDFINLFSFMAAFIMSKECR